MFSKGTANVTPADKKRLLPILRHIASKGPHFHTQCMNTEGVRKKYPDPKRRAAACAVLKDLWLGTTKWRGKDKD